MKILNWTHHYYFGCSLGATVSSALTSEYIDTFIEPIKVQVPPWYKEIWPVFFSDEKINPRMLNGDVIQPMGEFMKPYGHRHFGWLESQVNYAGYPGHQMIPFLPKQTLQCNLESRTVLIYPREHANKNNTYTLEWWISTCDLLLQKGFEIIAVLHDRDGHRDSISYGWCNQLKCNVQFKEVHTSTIPSLIAAISKCAIAIGIMTGPTWLCLKSAIKQIVLSSHADEPNESTARAETCCKYYAKPVTLSIGTNTDWINDL